MPKYYCCCRRPPRIPIGVYTINKKKPLPLKDIGYDVHIAHGLARVTLSQTYTNEKLTMLETVYYFPISSIGCFIDFEAVYEDRVVKGRIKQKEEAKKEYDQNLAKGNTVAYGEIKKDMPDIMEIRIGNLLPQAKVVVKLTFVQQLEVSQSKFWKLIIPSTLTPRYIQKVPSEKEMVKQNQIIPPSDLPTCTTTHKKYPWSIRVEIDDSPLNYISAISHPDCIIEKTINNSTKVMFSKQEFPTKDFSLIFQNTDKPGIPQTSVGMFKIDQNEHNYCGNVTFIPDLNDANIDDAMMAALIDEEFEPNHMNVPGEFIFLIDRSGSMGGNRIYKAKEALKLFIKSFPVDCYFNVVSFGTNYSFLYNESRKYTNQASSNALEAISAMQADMGGTEIFKALQKVFANPIQENYPRKIFLLTDGDVSSVAEVINLISKNCDGYLTKLYTIGIGNGASQHLIREGAKAGKGSYEFIGDNDDVSGRIISMLTNALLPSITNVKISYPPEDVTLVTPLPLESEYFSANTFFQCFFMFSDTFFHKKKTEIEISYQNSITLSENKLKLLFDISQAKMTDAYHKLAIKSYLDQAEYQETAKYHSSIKNDTKLAIDYQILCNTTAFICVISENSIDMGAFPQEKVIIPNLISNDYNKPKKVVPELCDIDAKILLSGHSMKIKANCAVKTKKLSKALNKPPVLESKSVRPMMNLCASSSNRANVFDEDCEEEDQAELLCFKEEKNSKDSVRMKKKESDQKLDTMHQQNSPKTVDFSTVVALQQIDGKWEYKQEVLNMINIDNAKIETLINENIKKLNKDIWITLVILAWLEAKHSENALAWGLIKKKGESWLKSQGVANAKKIIEDMVSLI